MIDALRKVIKRMHYPLEVMLTCVRWYAAYPLSLRHVEEMMAERGVFVDHSTVSRWAIRLLPVLEKIFRKYKRPVGGSWRMDETYIKVKGVWKYLYRAVDKEGKTIDFILTANRDKAAAKRFFDKAMAANGTPEKITMDKSGANKAAIDEINVDMEIAMLVRQIKYLPNSLSSRSGSKWPDSLHMAIRDSFEVLRYTRIVDHVLPKLKRHTITLR